MTLREFFLENFAGDLEYHPRRPVLYLSLGIAALCFWFFSPSQTQFTGRSTTRAHLQLSSIGV